MSNDSLPRAFVLSTTGHIGLVLLVLTASLIFRRSASTAYPAVYRVNLISLPQPAVEAETEAAYSEAPQAKPDAKPDPAPKPVQSKPSQAKAQVPGLPKGMKVVSVDGMSAEGSYYLGLILAKISAHWRNPYQGQAQEMRTQVYFKLDRSGELLEAHMEKPSGDGPFDQAALRAVYMAKPFPPFPPEMKLATLGVHFEFEYIK
jgi:protein TonB